MAKKSIRTEVNQARKKIAQARKTNKVSRLINFDTEIFDSINEYAKKENRSFHNSVLVLIDYALRHEGKQY